MSEGSALSARGKRPYYRPTTADQRKRLFEVYEETGSASDAAAAAHVGVSTFYYTGSSVVRRAATRLWNNPGVIVRTDLLASYQSL